MCPCSSFPFLLNISTLGNILRQISWNKTVVLTKKKKKNPLEMSYKTLSTMDLTQGEISGFVLYVNYVIEDTSEEDHCQYWILNHRLFAIKNRTVILRIQSKTCFLKKNLTYKRKEKFRNIYCVHHRTKSLLIISNTLAWVYTPLHLIISTDL